MTARQWLVALVARMRRLRSPLTLGERGERLACRHLRRQGMRIVEARYRLVYGEIDVVAVDGQTLVFTEVKTRRSEAQGRPAEAIDARRRRRLIRAAAAFLKSHQLLGYPSRFDVVEVIWPRDAAPTVRHFRHAFVAEGSHQFYR
jgi:putative endonuclease